MNPRIRELAEQAGITTNLDTDFFEKDPNKWVDYYSEKFAELIIRECMMLSVLQSEASYVSNYIAKHFGLDK